MLGLGDMGGQHTGDEPCSQGGRQGVSRSYRGAGDEDEGQVRGRCPRQMV